MQKSLFDELANTSIQNYINSLQNLSDIQIFDQILTDIEKAELAFDKQVALFEEAAKRRVITEEQANTRIEKARRDLEDKMSSSLAVMCLIST